jgi:RND family efflux transporter MFP subunit
MEFEMEARAEPKPPVRRSRGRLAIVIVVSVAVFLVAIGLFTRFSSKAALRDRAEAAAIPTVTVAEPQAGPPIEDVVLPGEVRGFLETPIYARTNGYIKSWRTDIGTRVKSGELLAVIESPEIDDQLRQADADLKTAQANAVVARSTSDRVAGLVATRSVSKQEGEDRAAAAAATASLVESNRANVARLKQLQGFEQVTAPYDGVITARETDVGNLINAGSGPGAELFRMADTHQLRTYVDVPQSYAGEIRVGTKAELIFPEHRDRTYPASVTRTASALDVQARTLRVELDVDNATGELLPGGFTSVHFKLPSQSQVVRVSGNTLLFRAEGLRVATVDADNKISLRPVRLGRDFGTTVEIVSGVTSNDRVVLNPPASIEDGDKVNVLKSEPAKSGGKS